MNIKVGRANINAEAAKKLGKEKFLKQHKHLRDPEAAWEAVEKATKKKETEN